MSSRRRGRVRLDAVVTVRCTRKQRLHWERWVAQNMNDVPLSAAFRTWADNATGVNDPPNIDAYHDGYLRRWHAYLTETLKARHRLGDTEMGVAASLVVCQCCLHGHDLFQALHPHFS